MLASCLGTIGDEDKSRDLSRDKSRDDVVVYMEAMSGLPLGTFRISREEVSRLVGLLGSNGLAGFGQTLRELIGRALDTSKTNPKYANILWWKELFTSPLQVVMVHPRTGDTSLLKEYSTGTSVESMSAEWTEWLQGKSPTGPLLRVVPVDQGTTLMRASSSFAPSSLLVCSLVIPRRCIHALYVHGMFARVSYWVRIKYCLTCLILMLL